MQTNGRNQLLNWRMEDTLWIGSRKQRGDENSHSVWPFDPSPLLFLHTSIIITIFPPSRLTGYSNHSQTNEEITNPLLVRFVTFPKYSQINEPGFLRLAIRPPSCPSPFILSISSYSQSPD